ncbi:MAG: DNA polymerase [Gammaproteobacteria bacterium]
MRKKAPRRVRAHRIARALAERYAAQRPLRRPLVRRITKPRTREIIAYDFETTPIAVGNPDPLYLTAYGADFFLAARISGYLQLAELLATRMLLPELRGTRFVAWNGNHFDAYFIARALLELPRYELRPYFAKGNKLRGLMVRERGSRNTWEFLDGIAMTGIQMRLGRFIELFAPDYAKLKGPDFEAGEVFDPKLPEHRKYAIRDSEGLYHAMVRAQSLLLDNFGVPFSATIGAAGIRIFQRKMPADVVVWQPPHDCLSIIRGVVYRGGYCVAMRPFRGRLWKYDVNQCYAGVMREAALPAGRCAWSSKRPSYARAWIARVSGHNRANLIPFYYRALDGATRFAMHAIEDTWLTCEEIDQLEREGWRLRLTEFWVWEEHFSMRAFVDELEAVRSACEGGPSGPIGTLYKAVGNNSYGKMAERNEAIEIQLSRERPEGFTPYDDVDGILNCVWMRMIEPPLREYHQPHVAAWITTGARMQLRRAALLAPRAFLYADTDSACFSQPVPLPLDRAKYGLWKLEADGARYIICNKKVYAAEDGSVKHAKGLHIDRLTVEDFIRWHDGAPPEQEQLQRRNWLRFLTGEPMFSLLSKTGQISPMESYAAN